MAPHDSPSDDQNALMLQHWTHSSRLQPNAFLKNVFVKNALTYKQQQLSPKQSQAKLKVKLNFELLCWSQVLSQDLIPKYWAL